jgi:hypothetical protein
VQTVAVAEVLTAEGLAPPVLNVLLPNEQNYTPLLTTSYVDKVSYSP